MRRPWQRFVKAAIEELQAGNGEGGELTEEAMVRIGRKCGWVSGYGPFSEKAIVRKCRGLLGQPDILAAMRDVYEVAADFTPVDAARKLIEHITTPTPKDPLGSLDALKVYHAMTVPKPARHLQIDQRTLVAKVMVSDEPPSMRARTLDSKPDAVLPPAR